MAGAALARCRLATDAWRLRRAALLVFVVVCVIVRIDAVRVSFFRVRMRIARTVGMSSGPVAVAYVVEQDQADNVRSKTERADDQNELGLRDFLGFDKSLNGFEEDRETQCDQEDAIHERTERLCALPLYFVRNALSPARLVNVLRRYTSWNSSSRSRP